MLKSTLLITFALIIAATLASENDSPQVTIKQGALKGKFGTTRKGKTYSAFTGIPYAKPPVEKLRFELAVPAEPWEGVFDATKPHAVCPQMGVLFKNYTVRGNEDCLYLNVYTPEKSDFENKKFAVMFFVHGGGFLLGEANEQVYGPNYLLDEDVVLVTANYRLGPLGFLSTGDYTVPGNNGLKDQNLALRWVKANIAHFGGNPDRITVFGQSAGGSSTHHHVLSPLSRNLIVGGIAQSGNAVAGWAVSRDGSTVRNTKKLAEYLACPTDCNTKMVECLKKVDAHKMIELETEFYVMSYDPPIPFRPVIEPKTEDAFIVEDPIEVIRSGKSENVSFMTGVTKEEGAMKTAVVFTDPELVATLKTNFSDVLSVMTFLRKDDPDFQHKVKLVKEFYFHNGEDYDIAGFTDMVSDSWFIESAEEAVELHSKYSKKPTYYYSFDYRGSQSFAYVFGGSPSVDYGVSHCDDLLYLFSTDYVGSQSPGGADSKMIEVMVKLWTNFAKTGNPTPETDSVIPNKWDPVSSDNVKYYSIKSDEDAKMSENNYAKRTQFWRNLLKDYVSDKNEL